MLPRTRRLHSFALWLALAGVLLRASVPFGYMPGWLQAGGHGNASLLALCSAGEHSALASAAAPVAGSEDQDGLGKLQAGCAFALAAAAALPPSPPAPSAVFLAPVHAPLALRAAAPESATASLPPARGPPEVPRIG